MKIYIQLYFIELIYKAVKTLINCKICHLIQCLFFPHIMNYQIICFIKKINLKIKSKQFSSLIKMSQKLILCAAQWNGILFTLNCNQYYIILKKTLRK